ncbi:MAG: SMC-Scp complex subunit ScpB [Eggerthellales bacterium]|nr:SMC-Scp complex subunit ScpB [Eggerthellales bacterium]
MIGTDLSGQIEALLFVSAEPQNPLAIADMVGVDVSDVIDALHGLAESYANRDSGIQLREVAGGWRMFTHPKHHALIEGYVRSMDTRKLSQAALETLAVVAYNQPITRNGIVSIRGVNSDSPISSLVEKGLIKEAGRENSPGQPILYATTRLFLEKFGLASTAQLPDIMEYAPDQQTRELIAARLGVTRAVVDQDALPDSGQLSLEDESLSFDVASQEGFDAFYAASVSGAPESVWQVSQEQQ